MKTLTLTLLLCLLGACTTTGDPNAGGLFSWRERKAQERQEELHNDIAAAAAETRRQTEEYEYLKAARDDAAARVAGLRQLVDAMLAENAQLRAGIAALVAQESEAAGQLTQLQARLPQYASGEFDRLGSERERDQWVSRLREQNRQLHEALGTAQKDLP